jgi:carbon storage regulator CsrA
MMLVLSRHVGEEIVIADRVRVRVAAVRGNRVQLAVAAPMSVPVYRGEIQQRRQEFASHRKLAGSSLEALFEPAAADARSMGPVAGDRRQSTPAIRHLGGRHLSEMDAARPDNRHVAPSHNGSSLAPETTAP